jgi:phytoene dehydrogenase-like protein
MNRTAVDAVVVGAGPNGLAAAIVLAQHGWEVRLIEAEEEVGGGARTAELTLPGYLHDPFSAVHPLGIGSPFLRALPLEEHGLEWIHSPAPLAHPLRDGSIAMLERSIDATCATLGVDAAAYRSLMQPYVRDWDRLIRDALAPLRFPNAPLLLARFGLDALQPAEWLLRRRFRGELAPALFAGAAAHSAVPLHRMATASFGLVLMAAGHAVGWPIARGGSGAVTQAMASLFRSLGGVIETGRTVRSLAELPRARAVLLNLTPRQLLEVAGDRLPGLYRTRLRRYRYGPAAFKVDYALSGPIPWSAAGCARAATVHLGGTLDRIARSERESWGGEVPSDPYVLVAQPSLFDATRAPAGRHTAWAYCHVPLGSRVDAAERIERQIERSAPGFRDLILARSAMGPAELERRNRNLVGGDINGGTALLGQLFLRPVARRTPYALPIPGHYLCSSSTPPGGGVHGMCGYHAAYAALRDRA